MQDLRVVGVENGALLVTSEDGTRFRIPVDEVLQSKLRQSVPDSGKTAKPGPREIQTLIRGGLSAEEVATTTGASLEYIQKFEGPVLAERNYVVSAAQSVPVHTALETDPLGSGSTFGSVIQDRLKDLNAQGERWASWKEQDGEWTVKLSFSAEAIEHDARWQFDPKKAALAPLNSDAVTLSQQGELAGALIPRLRAVGPEAREPDTTRFDSGAFTELDLEPTDTAPYREPVPFRAGQSSISPAAINREPDAENADGNHTADLLDALRRRRGERESAIFDEQEEARAAHPSTGSIRIVDTPTTNNSEPPPPKPVASVGKQSKKGRTAMPSWDDIVFGAKPDED